MKDTEVNEIYKLIWQEKSQNLTSYVHNKLFLLAGQPGSGKTALRNYTQAEYSYDLMIINSDELRERHPEFAKWSKDDPHNAPARVQKIVSAWMKKLIKQAIENRFNLLLDGTLSGNPAPIVATIQECRSVGYETEIRFLAVHPKISRLGIYLRYEEQMSDKGYGRFVNMYTHDLSCAQVPENLQVIYDSGLLDNLTLYGKGKGPNNVQMIMQYGSFTSKPLYDLILDLRADNLTESQAEYNLIVQYLLNLMKERNATIDYINTFQSDINM